MFDIHQNPAVDLTMTVLGCGTMGIAILSGILASLQDLESPNLSPTLVQQPGSTPTDIPARLPQRFIACVRRPQSAEKIQTALAAYLKQVRVAISANVEAVDQAQIVILACKPYMVSEILKEAGMADALRDKLLISICAGVTVDQIQGVLGHDSCTVLRAMPNTASSIRRSMTVIATSEPPIPAETESLVTWIFKRIGDIVYLPASTMDACTALCGSGPAFFALMLEAATDGAVAMGLPRVEAQRMTAQTMLGTASLVLSGEHPAILREKVCTPGGCTIGGLLVLEEGRIRGTVAKAVREATEIANRLGKGTKR